MNSYVDIYIDQDDWRASKIVAHNVPAAPSSDGDVLLPQSVLAIGLPDGDIRNHIKAFCYMASTLSASFIRFQKSTRTLTSYPPAYPSFPGISFTTWSHPDGTQVIALTYPNTPQWTTTPELTWDTELDRTYDIDCKFFHEYADGTTSSMPSTVVMPFSATLTLWNMLMAYQYWAGPPAA